MQEMGSYVDQDVRQKLTGMCEMFRVDVGSRPTNFYERQQELEHGVITVSNAVGGRSVGNNNNRNNNQERISKEMSDTPMGLKEAVDGGLEIVHN